jgi:glycosyltransferase involved in cell wall biosynthesis
VGLLLLALYETLNPGNRKGHSPWHTLPRTYEISRNDCRDLAFADKRSNGLSSTITDNGPMRIVHVLNSDETNIRGIATHVLCLAVAQQARGASILIVIDRPGVFVQMCHQRGIPVAVMAQELRPDGLPGALPSEKAMQGLAKQFRDFNAELIHCHDLQPAAQAIPAGNRLQIPCIFTSHGDVRATLDRLRFAKSLGMRFKIIAVCRADFERLKESSGMPETDIYYVPYGTQSASPAGPGEAFKSHRPNLILVGVLEPRKGIDVAIMAMAELRRRRGQACPTLSIYGESSEKLFYAYYREMVELSGLSDIVRFCGVQPGILERCPSGDILIVPSRAETGPIVVLEAMSRGMPIVASDVGDVAEMLPDPRYGRVIPVMVGARFEWVSIAALTDAIESLLSEIADGRFDPDLLIDRHRSFYTVERMTESIDIIYKENSI